MIDEHFKKMNELIDENALWCRICCSFVGDISFIIARLSDAVALAVIEFIQNWALVFITLLYMHDLFRLHVNYDWIIGLQFLHRRTNYTTACNILAGHLQIVKVKFCKINKSIKNKEIKKWVKNISATLHHDCSVNLYHKRSV